MHTGNSCPILLHHGSQTCEDEQKGAIDRTWRGEVEERARLNPLECWLCEQRTPAADVQDIEPSHQILYSHQDLPISPRLLHPSAKDPV